MRVGVIVHDKALALRGEQKYSKLWGDISTFNKQLGLKQPGYLDELRRFTITLDRISHTSSKKTQGFDEKFTRNAHQKCQIRTTKSA